MLGTGGASLLVVSAAGFVGVTVPTFPGLGKLEPLIHLYAAACWPTGVAMLVARGFLSAEVRRVKDLDPTPLAKWVAAGLLAMAPLSHVSYDTCPHGYYIGVGRLNVVLHGERCGNTRHMKRLFVPW